MKIMPLTLAGYIFLYICDSSTPADHPPIMIFLFICFYSNFVITLWVIYARFYMLNPLCITEDLP